MQPTLVVTSPAEGLVHINGRLAGETGPETPLIFPVTPNGTIYLEFMPFGRRFRPAAHRLTAKSGSIDTYGDTYHLVSWPGGVTEISLKPLTAMPAESEFSVIDGLPAAMLRGEASLLRIGRSSIALPDGASLPDNHTSANGAELYMGKAGSMQYIAAFASDSLTPLGAVTGDTVTYSDDNITSASDLNDAAGHVRIDTYSLSHASLEHTSTAYTFGEKGRARPADAEKTAIAAIEALLLGLTEEAAEYLAGGLTSEKLQSSINDTDAVLPIRYGIPNAHPAIGLVHRTGSHTAVVTPLYYRSSLSPDGSHKIIAVKREGEALK